MFSFIPLPYKIIAFIIIIGGALGLGYSKGLEKSKLEIAKFEAKANEKIAALEKQNGEISNKVVTEYVDRVKTIKEKEYVYVKQAENSVPSQHDMSNGWVYLHDSSAKGLPAVPARVSDERPSGVKDNIALGTIASNYSVCYQNSEQLRALQKWLRDTKAAVDKENGESKNE